MKHYLLPGILMLLAITGCRSVSGQSQDAPPLSTKVAEAQEESLRALFTAHGFEWLGTEVEYPRGKAHVIARVRPTRAGSWRLHDYFQRPSFVNDQVESAAHQYAFDVADRGAARHILWGKDRWITPLLCVGDELRIPLAMHSGSEQRGWDLELVEAPGPTPFRHPVIVTRDKSPVKNLTPSVLNLQKASASERPDTGLGSGHRDYVLVFDLLAPGSHRLTIRQLDADNPTRLIWFDVQPREAPLTVSVQSYLVGTFRSSPDQANAFVPSHRIQFTDAAIPVRIGDEIVVSVGFRIVERSAARPLTLKIEH